jgi:hypothetical protein
MIDNLRMYVYIAVQAFLLVTIFDRMTLCQVQMF